MITTIYIIICALIFGIFGYVIRKNPNKKKAEVSEKKLGNLALGVVIIGSLVINFYDFKKISNGESKVSTYSSLGGSEEEFESDEKITDVNKQFSSWNGAHIKLQDFIKENMKDPSSYEHVETKYKNLGDVLIVVTKYRGKNSFGALILQETKAKCDIETGDVLSIE